MLCFHSLFISIHIHIYTNPSKKVRRNWNTIARTERKYFIKSLHNMGSRLEMQKSLNIAHFALKYWEH